MPWEAQMFPPGAGASNWGIGFRSKSPVFLYETQNVTKEEPLYSPDLLGGFQPNSGDASIKDVFEGDYVWIAIDVIADATSGLLDINGGADDISIETTTTSTWDGGEVEYDFDGTGNPVQVKARQLLGQVLSDGMDGLRFEPLWPHGARMLVAKAVVALDSRGGNPQPIVAIVFK